MKLIKNRKPKDAYYRERYSLQEIKEDDKEKIIKKYRKMKYHKFVENLTFRILMI